MANGHTEDRDVHIRRALTRWYDSHRRDLPWRRTQDPYAMWVSEIMLQQTRVETVTPYYTRWMARFPTVGALAEAPLDDVLVALGRARLLRARAQPARGRARGRGRIRRRLSVDGGGAARAARASASTRPAPSPASRSASAAPIVDGNVVRVLARVDALEGAADDAALKKQVWARAGELVRADGGQGAGDFNQAMMELGATVCTPASPGCSRCPLVTVCRARAADAVAGYPGAKTKKPPRAVDAVAVLVERDGKLLFVRRPPSGLWGGLWEPPWRAEASGGKRRIDDGVAARVAKSCTGLALSNIQSVTTLRPRS